MRGSTHIVSPIQHSPGWDQQVAEPISLLQFSGAQDLWDIHREAIYLELSISGLLGTQCSFPESPINYVTHLKEAYPVLVIWATHQGPTSENAHATQWLTFQKWQTSRWERAKDHLHVQ